MIAKTEAIVLRVAPFSRTSHVVTWLARDYGRLSTVVRGALRPKSAFLGQYDLFYSCELLFYEREHNGLHTARECTPLAMRTGLRRDWRAYTCAACICDLVYQSTLPGGEWQGSVFELLNEVLDMLDRDPRHPILLLHWFELRLLTLLGYAPHLERCVACNAALSQQRAGFDAARGGALCLGCLPRPAPDRVVPVGPDTQALLRRWSGPGALGLLRNTVVSPKQLLALQALAGTMLAYSMEIRPECRDVAVATLGWKEE